jgi:putative ABC transport system permease protein
VLKNYFIIAWRNLKKNKFFAFINVLGLSLGLCSCLVIFLSYQFELSFDNFHPNKERIYRITSHIESDRPPAARIPPPMPAELRKEITGVSAISCTYPYYVKSTIRGKNNKLTTFDSQIDGTENVRFVLTDSNYFSIFTYKWLVGSAASSLDHPFEVVLSESQARRYFGAGPLYEMIGKEVVYDDSIQARVSGIVQDWNKNTDFPYTDFISLSTSRSSSLRNRFQPDNPNHARGNAWVWSFVRLSDNTTPDVVSAQLRTFVAHHFPASPLDSLRLALQPLSNIHFSDNYNGDDIRKASLPALHGIMAIAVFILLIAIINFVNLSTAQSIQRSREIGVRKVLGSSRTRIILQFLTESLLLTLFAMCLALVMIKPILFVFRDFLPPGLIFNPLTPSTLLFFLAGTFFTAVLAGLYPAKVLSSYLPALGLRGAGDYKGGDKWWLRKSLIVFQFTLSLFFIIGTFIVVRQVNHMLTTDTGLKTDAILNILTYWKEDVRKIKIFEGRVKQLPGITQVVRQGGPPIGWGRAAMNIKYKGREEIQLKVSVERGNEDFIPFYEMRLVAGRNLLHGDSLKELVINETYSRALGFKSPGEAIGKYLYQDTGDSTEKGFPIVGVVADFHDANFHETIGPVVIEHDPANELNLGIKLASTDLQAGNLRHTLDELKKIWKEVYPKTALNPNNALYFRFLDDTINSFYKNEKRLSFLMKVSVIVSTFISCIGLLGIAIFTTEKRMKEIAIRKILGADILNIATMLVQDFVFLVTLSLLISSPIAWYFMHRWLQDFAYRIIIPWWIFPFAGICTIGIVLLTVGLQVIKAALANPVNNLRIE